MKMYRNLLLLTALTAGTLAIATMASATAQAAGGAYCIAQGGPNGEASYVGNCIYATYEQCNAATVGSGNNCVGNIDDNRNALARMRAIR